MATVRWHLDELSGATLTLRLYPLTSGTIANTGGDAMTESGAGLFAATVSESLNGWHKAYADEAGEVSASGFVNMSDASPVVVESVAASSSAPTQVVVGRYTDDDATSPLITCKIGELGVAKSVTVEDSAGVAVDLTDWGNKVLVIERATPPRTDVQVIEHADITISGDDNEVFTFTPSEDVLERAGDFKWSLREVSSGDVIIDGRLSVTYSPLEDEA